MKKTEQGLTIYSVGVDDGGAPFDTEKGTAGADDIRFKVRGR